MFLDRDGVLNERRVPFVRRAEQFRWRPGAKEALALARAAGWRLVVVTNQWPVGAGYISKEEIGRIHDRMSREAADAGGALDRIEACMHHPRAECDDRKPSPKMLQDAARDLRIDLRSSWMVGDQLKDVLAGRAAGCRTALVNPALRPGVLRARRLADVVLPGLPDLVDRLVGDAHPSRASGR